MGRGVAEMRRLDFGYQGHDLDIQNNSLDIKTVIEAFRISVLILRLGSRPLEIQSHSQDWYKDF